MPLEWPGQYGQQPSGTAIPTSTASGTPVSIIDGTPIRVAAVVLFCMGGIVFINKVAKIKFSSTVSVS